MLPAINAPLSLCLKKLWGKHMSQGKYQPVDSKAMAAYTKALLQHKYEFRRGFIYRLFGSGPVHSSLDHGATGPFSLVQVPKPTFLKTL